MVMADWDRDAFENALIEDMRAHGGVVTQGPLAGHPILVLTMTGAKSGKDRRALLTYSKDGDDYVVAGTAGGSPTTPAWVHNVEANPDVRIEVDNGQHAATARIVPEDERQPLWERHIEALPHFAGYPEQAKRFIPLVRIHAED
jgi:deazaflavin-dependent oxidoreductase (nitroreductase family)